LDPNFDVDIIYHFQYFNKLMTNKFPIKL